MRRMVLPHLRKAETFLQPFAEYCSAVPDGHAPAFLGGRSVNDFLGIPGQLSEFCLRDFEKIRTRLFHDCLPLAKSRA